MSPSVSGCSAILAGLHERFLTVDGIDACLAYEPTALAPSQVVIYSLLERFEIEHNDNLTLSTVTYEFRHRLCLPWHDPEQADVQLRQYADLLPAAVEEDVRLDGRLKRGMAVVATGEAGWAVIGQAEYRILDLVSRVIETRRATRIDLT